MIWEVLLVFWLACAAICAFAGPRKGYTPVGAFTIGLVFGIFGVVYLALKDDV